eukprot:GDKH01006251.1.p1 GENE.GDKH01006251.1~~GDKH01006251.1.p1  ORF type:complete len:86 (+),score=15.58 GDKH01006251.1:89-346(+)
MTVNFAQVGRRRLREAGDESTSATQAVIEPFVKEFGVSAEDAVPERLTESSAFIAEPAFQRHVALLTDWDFHFGSSVATALFPLA